MSTRARTRSATAASASNATPTTQVKPQPKPKSQSRKTAQPVAVPDQPEEKENIKTKTIKTKTKAPPKPTAAPRRPTRSTPAVHCLCKKGDDGTPMVRCGECKIWYHFQCVDLKEEDAEDINVYICPPCTKTGLRTTMTWEGEDAFEKLTVDAEPTPIPEKEPPMKKIKRDSPVDPPASESEGDPSSEDEYVADAKVKGKGIAKRPTRRLSFSSESDSEASDDARVRRHRIKKRTSSPTPNALKRKSHRSTETPPPKRKKSDAAIPTDDPTRKYCLTKLEDLFRDVFLRYPHVRMEGEDGKATLVERPLGDLTDEEKNALIEESKRFADELERCVFDIYSEQDKAGMPSAGSNYKDRFRMLQFNLSKVDRVVIHQRIVSAEITPKEISLMSSTDLANEETKQSIKIAEKEALAYSILKPTTAPRAKITHKGLEDIEDVHGGVSTIQDEERSRVEEEERRERERVARLKTQTQPRQRTTSVSVPPESPIVAQAQQPWGGPPPVPLHAMLPGEGVPSSPTVFLNESSPIVPTFAQSFTDTSEPELNLADFINIDEEVPVIPTASAASSSPPVLNETATLTSPPSLEQPEPSPISSIGISPFAQKPESSTSMSFDLNALWNAPKTETTTSPLLTEESAPSTSSPHVAGVGDDKDTVMDIEGGGADDYDFDMFLEEKDAAINSAEAQQAALDALPQVWSGKINMPLDTTSPQEVSVNARQVGGRPLPHDSVLWKTLFPSELLRIDGRVPVENSAKFLLQMRMNVTKELIAVALAPSPESDDVGFRILSDFLIAKGRHGLVFPWGQKPKEHHPGRELYIIPLLSSDPLPEYMELLDDLHLPKLRKTNLLVGIWVLNKGKLAAPVAPPTPTIPSFASMHQHIQPPATPSAPTPPFPHAPPVASPLPAAIAAEVASLTPEQIQLMIQTLTANGSMPLPVLPPGQNQPQLHSHAPPPPPPPMVPSQHRPQVYPLPTQPWTNNAPGYGGGMYPPPPNQRPAPLSWDRPGGESWDRPADNYTRMGHDRDDRGGRGRGGNRGGGRGRGRGNDIPQKPVDSGWPRRARNDQPGPSSPARHWG